MIIPDKVYDILKWLCLIALPALSTLYWSLATIWGWPYVEQISGTLAAVGTFFGVLIGVSTVSYYKAAEDEDKDCN